MSITVSIVDDTKKVPVSYTPTYTTQHSLSAPMGLRLNADGSETSLTISVTKWSGFPTNKSLYGDLAGAIPLSNGSKSVDMVIKKSDDTVVAVGDRIGTFKPTTMSSDTSAECLVLAVVPAE